MKSLIQYFIEHRIFETTRAVDMSKEKYHIGKKIIRNGEGIWVHNPDDERDVYYGIVKHVNERTGIIHLLVDNEYQDISTDCFVQTDKDYQKEIYRQKEKAEKARQRKTDAEKNRIPKRIAALQAKLQKLQYELDKIYQEQDTDPDAIADAQNGGGKVADEYGRRMNRIYKQIDKCRDELNQLTGETAE